MMENYIDGVMNYTGSKFKLLNQILPEMDYKKPYFVDLFTGGGSIYTNVVDRFDKLIANDIIKDLIGIHSSLIKSDSIITDTKSLCPGKTNQGVEGVIIGKALYTGAFTLDEVLAVAKGG